MKCLGLCIGASTISYTILKQDTDSITLLNFESISHDGHPISIIKKLHEKINFNTIDKIVVTGRKFRHIVNASTISEAEAIESAYKSFKQKILFHNSENSNNNTNNYSNVNLILSAGGETFMAYELDSNGNIIQVYTGNKCASGTGEFFLQQIGRMNLTLEEAMLPSDNNESYKVAGRCSVFCKSDCTHALNKGVSKDTIVAGLCEMMGRKLLELTKKTNPRKIMLIGGTTSNFKMVDFLKKQFSNLIVPFNANYFESYGAALWGLENDVLPVKSIDNFFKKQTCSFSFLPNFNQSKDNVVFKPSSKGEVQANDECIIGLDVGSTTTKAVLISVSDDTILADCYLRTNGDPIAASKQCYANIASQITKPIKIIGLGVTGSGRQIAGLHSLTPSVMNEIIAHAQAAIYFDKDVDTIFEIGGQDAKYTYITNGVPTDYAMNEACSAGTGSFLEEATKESLDIELLDIEKIALKSKQPPNFSDQCSAFISSDIKTAIQERIPIEDITAGLVYSICMNYINRVKGNRPVGKKIFMQGGVCYNKAVPIAMAALTNQSIIVPPNPGLMGAFGAALETKKKLDLNIIQPIEFDLNELSTRDVTYKEPFICSGGKEKCDRKCSINRIVINDKTYPFGGACNKYDKSYTKKQESPVETIDLANYREQLVYKTYSTNYAKRILPTNNKKIGMQSSLLTNTLYPLFYNFFYSLGYDIELSTNIDLDGTEQKSAAFCYPVEVSHGLFSNLLQSDIDYLFLPHVKSVPTPKGSKACVTCPFVQSEPYYLQSAFKTQIKSTILSPVLDFRQSYNTCKNAFIKLGLSLGHKKSNLEQAYACAIEAQISFHKACKTKGLEVIKELEKHPNQTAIVLFGRPYNAFSRLTNMGIPHKFTSREYPIIPLDFLPYDEEENFHNMYWAMGQMILKATQYIKKHPQLFGCYITNFSCGPDSFIINYFREILDKKPSLILELDSHTADAGIDTRIEAFLDIITRYRNIKQKNDLLSTNFKIATTKVINQKLYIIDSDGKEYPLTHSKVHVLIPSMGDMGSKLLAATFRHEGVKATALVPPTENELQKGRSHASCKECMPLMLTVGSLMNYLDNRKVTDELIVYFMPETSGPCRFGQYNTLMKQIIKKQQIRNVALFSLTSETSYAGLGTSFVLRAWQSVLIADILEEIHGALLALSTDSIKGLYKYEKICKKIIHSVEHDSYKSLKSTLENAAKELSTIELKQPLSKAVKVALIGEIYVRRDHFSRHHLVERLSNKGIVVKTSPIAEWIYYCDYIVKNRLGIQATYKDRMRTRIQEYFKIQYEKTIKKIFATSGLYEYHLINVDKIIDQVSDVLSPQLTGEAILTLASAIDEIIDHVDGVLSIGPFGCMPSRIAESIISTTINNKKIEVSQNKDYIKRLMDKFPHLPFLSVEVDGNVLPQLSETKLEAFCLQVQRLHNEKIKLQNNNVIQNKA